ncbi:hypothetical protein SODALDRAFT_74230 [Sodiomyces alkalinus F11]|uniref:Uncharacterized protein n=1 Tax=Sodiomyces alkalinus (strain CBS 110278 / VKM F-3762 / F11) TaxID=1314773 RepID=A0A3N2PK84_SODAK|nr:hypothetical protein SODALDRAFT_74230 [Sodiomyces alkalinus F11]ROT34938.1 hypothetical protein SODALDRAFT_74230 [Sodiomyces alkalinus F11]
MVNSEWVMIWNKYPECACHGILATSRGFGPKEEVFHMDNAPWHPFTPQRVLPTARSPPSNMNRIWQKPHRYIQTFYVMWACYFAACLSQFCLRGFVRSG